MKNRDTFIVAPSGVESWKRGWIDRIHDPEHDQGRQGCAANRPKAAPAYNSRGDLIVAVNARVVTGVDDLHRLLAGLPLDRPFALSVVRGGDLLEIPSNPASPARPDVERLAGLSGARLACISGFGWISAL